MNVGGRKTGPYEDQRSRRLIEGGSLPGATRREHFQEKVSNAPAGGTWRPERKPPDFDK